MKELVKTTSLYYELKEKEGTKNKPLVVCLHGFLSSSFSFRKIIPLLRDDFSVLNLDWPPFGASKINRRFTYSYENIANLVIRFIKNLAYDKIILIGHSMGGQLALHIAKYAPELVEKLVLLSCSCFLPKATRKQIVITYLPFSTAWLRKKFQDQGVEANLKLCLYDQSILTKELIEGYEKPFLSPAIFPELKKFIRDREGDLSREELTKLKIPTLLLWGKHDKVVPLEKGQKLLNILPNAKLIVYPNAGHLVPEENPEQVVTDIKDFLSENI